MSFLSSCNSVNQQDNRVGLIKKKPTKNIVVIRALGVSIIRKIM